MFINNSQSKVVMKVLLAYYSCFLLCNEGYIATKTALPLT